MRTFRSIVAGLVLLTAAAAPARAQAPVTSADLARLEATATEIRRQADTLKASDPTLAAEVEKSLTTLDEDITYLRVKLRRNEVVTRDEYGSLRDRLETLRIRATGKPATMTAPVTEPEGKAFTVPVGTQLDVRLQTPLSSATAKAEDRFEATTVVDFTMGNDVVIPAGSLVRGFVSSVRPAGRLDRKGSLTLSFDELRIGQTSRRLRASVVQALDGKMGEDATRIGAGAIVGGIIGGLLGGGKGALLGVLVGGGGTIAATEGSDVELPLGTILRIRVDEALEIVR
ncbi:MAG: hypothetical protein R2752_01100 [Vicinamibacterales bacterium]